MNGKKLLLIVLIINLVFLGFYLSVNTISAADEDQAEATSSQEESQNSQDQWEMIRLRQEELKVREQELKELEILVEEKIKKLESLEASIQAEVNAYRQLSDERIRHLVKIYSSMKPKAAASLMNQLDLDVAVEVFLNMKGDIAGGILSYMDTQKAATITKKLANYRNIQSNMSGQP
jgi:flagellar motility protein MotE (MotC chaperone)